MSDQRVECPNCKAHWDYNAERLDYADRLSHIPKQGCICPVCGCLDGVIKEENEAKIE